MAEVVLFHHALGLTPGLTALADDLRAAGHDVHVPDLYDGRTFETIEAGVAHAREVGFDALDARADDVVAPLAGEVTYLGFSLGVLAAQRLAQTRPGARGAVLVDACMPVSEFGSSWPATVPVQVHGMDADPFFAEEGDLDAARDLVAGAADGDLFLYPGSSHLFVDRSLPSYDAPAAETFLRRLTDFLRRS